MILGLTGLYCAGKNQVAALFARKGWFVIDVDKLGHQVLIETSDQVIEQFGRKVADAAGGVDRKALGRLVFSDPKLLAQLEQLIHPEMVRRTLEQAEREEKRHPAVVINAALLEKMGLDKQCDQIIVVKAPFLLRLLRALRRDKLTLFQALTRLIRQKSILSKNFLKHVDRYNIRNVGTPKELERKVSSLEKQLRSADSRQG